MTNGSLMKGKSISECCPWKADFTVFAYIFQGVMMYEVVGTGAAPSFFSVDAVGRVYTRGLLRTDRALTYVVSKVTSNLRKIFMYARILK